jgi:hypothetical protein
LGVVEIERLPLFIHWESGGGVSHACLVDSRSACAYVRSIKPIVVIFMNSSEEHLEVVGFIGHGALKVILGTYKILLLIPASQNRKTSSGVDRLATTVLTFIPIINYRIAIDLFDFCKYNTRFFHNEVTGVSTFTIQAC